ncbi:hypothetical protein ACJRPK_02940 [Aquimarina sp. 2-A2]|uniref:hypothetical protein n=1 Tax=Aquimarina sp. 2-A2 TaxID=3382644 RepID=UPI00387F0B00
MKRQLLLKAILTSFLIAFNSCSDDGVDGTNGVDGKDGVDATGSVYLVLSGNISNDEAKAALETKYSENTQVILVTNTTALTTLDLTGVPTLVDLEIRNNEKLTTINAPDLSEVLNTLEIDNNSQLTSLNFTALKFGDDITVSENNKLESMQFDALIGVHDHLYFYSNKELRSLSLSNFVGNDRTYLGIIDNPKLNDLNLSKLVDLDYLSISATALTTIEIPQIINSNRISLRDNSMLETVSFPKLEKITDENGSGFSIYNSSPALSLVSLPLLTQASRFNIYSYEAQTAAGSLVLSSIIDFDDISVNYYTLRTADVDALLSHLVSITPAITEKYIYLYGSPSAQGDTDASTLRSNGNSVNFRL